MNLTYRRGPVAKGAWKLFLKTRLRANHYSLDSAKWRVKRKIIAIFRDSLCDSTLAFTARTVPFWQWMAMIFSPGIPLLVLLFGVGEKNPFMRIFRMRVPSRNKWLSALSINLEKKRTKKKKKERSFGHCRVIEELENERSEKLEVVSAKAKKVGDSVSGSLMIGNRNARWPTACPQNTFIRKEFCVPQIAMGESWFFKKIILL